MRILIVEDDFVSRRLLKTILSKYGDCDIAVNGEEAIEAFHLAWLEGSPYKLICLDLGMPVMDGHSVLKELRTYEAENGIKASDEKRASVIITSGSIDEDNVRQGHAGGCDAYLTKPIDREGLIRMITGLHIEPDCSESST
jgi:two-component system chemotaxis response regulator CheY